ncbi:MAG: hypothetical protein JWM68_2958 [Verrucomicrobiales bacterium]|nr:hypothetical protein [Verrucomicrobiales bacterium]
MANWQHANVLNVNPDRSQVWQFSTNNGKFVLSRELTVNSTERVPSDIGGKGWRGMLRKKVNIAWLPVERVFLRALQLPAADFAETLSMIDLQLEKISPLPVAQIVWTIDARPPQPGSNLQTVVVVIVSRILVEEYLGRLEERGYLTDRLELPVLDQLLSTSVTEDGVWIYPGVNPEDPCLVAWWYGGVLQNATLLAGISAPEQQERFKEQILQIAWSGELDGWLTGQPKWHVVATPEIAQRWEPMVAGWADETVEVVPPIPVQQVAALSAKRAAQSGAASLMPSEYTTRYQQQNVDRLWMRGLFGLLVLYMVGLVIYGSAVLVLNFQLSKVKSSLASISGSYTNVVQMKERVTLLQEQAALKYAALDAWKAASDLLPEGLTLTSFTFARGQTMQLFGTVPQDQQRRLTDYNEAMQSAMINGKPLEVDPPNTRPPRPDRSGQMVIDWSFNCNIPGVVPK